MKTFFRIVGIALIVSALASCNDFLTGDRNEGNGTLTWNFDFKSEDLTKALQESIPDTNDFILVVKNSAGKELYNGTYGASPEKLDVPAGNYTLSVRSIEFKAPAFAAPLYGDDQVVVVPSGSNINAKLNCTLLNCGIRLNIESNFLTNKPNAVLYVKSADGKLMYSYREKRAAYFNPGTVSLVMTEGSSTSTLLTRYLEARDMLSITVSAPNGASSTSERISVAVDTSRYWSSEKYVIGEGTSGNEGGSGSGSGEDISSAVSVTEAKTMAGEMNVWVYGYIVGGDLTSSGSSMNTGPDFTKNTHIAIAARSSVTEKSSCMSVELKIGDIRDALNLVSNPELLGRKVYLKGNIVESYFGIPGIKATSDYQL